MKLAANSVGIACLTGWLYVGGMPAPTATAGDHQWATAGKILTGVVIAHVLTHGIDFPPARSPRVVRQDVRVIHTVPSCTRTVRIVESPRHCRRVVEEHCWSEPTVVVREYHPPIVRRRYHDFCRPPSTGYRRHGHDYGRHSGTIVYESSCRQQVIRSSGHGYRNRIHRRPFIGSPWITTQSHSSIW